MGITKRHGRTLALLIAGLLISGLVFSNTATLQPTKDNTLYEPISPDGFTDRSDGAGPTMFVGKVKDADADPGTGTRPAVRRGVLAFDIAGNIPAGATINSAQLTLYADKVAVTTSYNVSLNRLFSNWGEGTSNTGNSQQGRGEPPTTGDATWHHTFYPTLFWTLPGGDYTLTASATRTVGNTGFYTWGSTSGLVADVQSWLSNPAQNFGWIIIGTETTTQTTKRFGTRENTGSTGGVSWKPKLVIDYTPQAISGGCCQGGTCTIQTAANCLSVGGTYRGDGTSCTPNPCVAATGACCASNGTCSEVSQSTCTTGGGAYQGDGSTCATADCPIQLTPYLDALPIPPIATPTSGTVGGAATYTITMREFEQQLHSQLPPTRVWGYHDGVSAMSTPGPIIVARTGMPVTVNWVNDIRDFVTNAPRTNNHYLAIDTMTDSEGMTCIHGAENKAKTVVHLHGGHVPAAFDGYPESTFLPGDPPVTYTYPNDQQAGFIWFHDHALGVTRLNVYMGLAGAYLIRDSVEDAINLPAGQYEVPLVIQDKKLNPDGSLKYPAMWMDHWFGDKVMVNGKIWPYLSVKKGKYRFKLLNGSTSRVYTLSLVPPSGTLNFTVVGDEGGLLEAPVPGVGSLTIGPGERYEVIVDFVGYASGDHILLQNSAAAPFPNGVPDLPQVMEFRVTNQAGDVDPIPATLRPIQRLNPAQAVQTRDFRLKQDLTDGCGRSMWSINSLRFDDITEYPELGTVEIWRYINDSGVSHPMHMHLVMFQILDRDGFTKGPNGEIIPNGTPQAPGAEESGWKDTAMVAPGQILRVITRFDAYKGRYPYHCHILEHEEHDMMRQFQTVQCGDAAIDPTEECDDGNLAGGDACSAGCDNEYYYEVGGLGQGGTVQITVSGVVITVNTTPGETPEQVVAALAAAINANPTLSGMGITAIAMGRRLITVGTMSAMTLGDPGLTAYFGLTMEPALLWWSSMIGATSYDVVRGDAATLQSTGGDFAQATKACVADNRVETSMPYTAVPAVGEVWWFAARKVTGGGNGTYDGGDATQVGSRDAEIAASGHGCP
ncbi:MAG TPA: multicopper oxidase domain-containing protein [Candidatus Polarisedimenticolia bacterium]|jgi:spore coat protein A|nr:multicopper oxidase domain-containing protein [Candidatus Polarisedimenticolia bacterium]